MNLCEEGSSRPHSVEPEEQTEGDRRMEDRPSVTTAPDATAPQEQPSASALQSLDELLLNTSGETELRRVRQRLQDALQRTQGSELELLEKARCCRAELDRLQEALESEEERGVEEEQDREVIVLRQQLLQTYSHLRGLDDREQEAQRELRWLQEEKLFLGREKHIHPDPAVEMLDRCKDLEVKCEDLRAELEQTRLEIRSLTDDLFLLQKETEEEQTRLTRTEEELDEREAERARLRSRPELIVKQSEEWLSQKKALQQRGACLSEELMVMRLKLEEMTEKSLSLRKEQKDLMKALKSSRAQHEVGERTLRRGQKNLDVLKEENMELTGKRGLMELKLHNLLVDKLHFQKLLSVQRQELSRKKLNIRKMEQELEQTAQRLQSELSYHQGLKGQVEALPKRGAGLQRRLELQKELEALKDGFEKQVCLEDLQTQRKQLWFMEDVLKEELHQLQCLTQIKTEERAQKHRDLLRAQHIKVQTEEELKEKELIVLDLMKMNSVLQDRQSQLGLWCLALSEEKNRYRKLKEAASGTRAELMERAAVLDNEAEIQRSIVTAKERLVTKARMKTSHSCTEREKLRHEVSKAAWKLQQTNQEFEDNKLELLKRAQTIQRQEGALLDLSKALESAVQRRDSLGVQLLEHDEVLLSFYEKVRAQEAGIARAAVTMEMLEKEAREAELQVKEEERQVELRLKELPLTKQMEEEVTLMRIQSYEARDRTLRGLDRETDHRELTGKDPSVTELRRKIQQLEERLAEREKQLLEKVLLVEQVSRLTEPLRRRLDDCREDRLRLSQKLNETRQNLLRVSNKLMGATADLALKQALLLALQQDFKDKELQMQRCQDRLAQDLPPCPELEDEWRKMLREKRRRQKEERERVTPEAQWRQLPNGTFTTAPWRPNVYIPEGSELPLPRPYGAMGPFKPTPPGANMRHFRKACPKPLDL